MMKKGKWNRVTNFGRKQKPSTDNIKTDLASRLRAAML
jgi:hypothetical protein